MTVPVVLVAGDLAVAVVSTLAAIYLRREVFPGLIAVEPFSPVRNYLNLWPALALLLLTRGMFGLYPGYGLNPAEELKRQTIATFGLVSVVLGGSALFQFSEVYSRIVLTLTAALLFVCLPLSRAVLKSLLSRSQHFGEKVWVLGSSDRVHDLTQVLMRHPTLGFRFAGTGVSVPASRQGIRHCLVVPEGIDSVPLAQLLDQLSEQFDRVWLAPNLLDVASVWVSPTDLQGHLALELRNNLLEPHSRALKRLADVCLCALSLPVTLPAIVLISLWLRVTYRGSVFVRQTRVGRAGRKFKILKFRTMYEDSEATLETLLDNDPSARHEWQTTRKLRNDPRVTPVGRFLRRSSLDELPQILNVLIGQMSLVGPRPVMPDEIERYGTAERLYIRVQPGITGLTQVSGRSDLAYQDRVRLDIYYVRNWSIWLDFVLIARTFGSVLRRDGAF